MDGPAPISTRCAVHPETDAQGICSRCGAFVCADCARRSSADWLCAACERRAQDAPASREALAAAGLAMAGLAGFVPGIVGLWLAYREAARIRAGDAPVAGEAYVTVAKALGWFHVAALIVLGALAVQRWVG